MRKITILIVTGIIIRYMLVTLLAYNVRIGWHIALRMLSAITPAR